MDIPLAGERQKNIQEAARVLQEKFSGFVISVFEEARWDAWLIAQLLVQSFPLTFGSDWYDVDGVRLMLAKRAQLLPMLYDGRSQSSSGALKNLLSMEKIGPICDYQLPKTLEHLGILRYHPEFKKKIQDKVVILKGSPEEIEIRTATSVSVHYLLRHINARRKANELKEIHSGHIDNLFFAGRKLDINHHITPTMAY